MGNAGGKGDCMGFLKCGMMLAKSECSAMIFFRSVFVILVAAGVCLGPVASWAKDKDKKPKVSELMKDANDLMTQAQTAYVDGKSKEAIELYRKALADISRVERENEKMAGSTEFAPVRFRKALCETEIDRIMLEDVNATSRTMAVTDTRALEAKRAARNKAAETNNQQEAAIKLASKQGVKPETDGAVPESETVVPDPVEADKPAPVPVEAGKPAPVDKAKLEPAEPDKPVSMEPGKTLNVSEELEWAKDMISVDRFDDAEKALMAVLKLHPENRDARFMLALSRVQQGRAADAAVIVDDLLADHPDDESALLLAAGAYATNGHYGKAMDALDKAMKANPKRPDGYLNMAWLLLEMKTKDVSEAEMYYRQAVKLGGVRDRDIERRLGIKAE